MSVPLAKIAVVIPARNEAPLLPATLRATRIARNHLLQSHPHVAVSVTVVLDSTSDGSAEFLARQLDVHTLSVNAGLVGTVRNTGIYSACTSAATPLEQLWIANTDADSEVPPHWLQQHVELAAKGAQVVVGTVEPQRQELDPVLLQRWLSLHDLREGHHHIHGANLGIRADVFTRLGGFKDQGLHEDRDLVTRARALGVPVVATDSCRVKTSGRLQGRVSGGFADFLATLNDSGQAQLVLSPPQPTNGLSGGIHGITPRIPE